MAEQTFFCIKPYAFLKREQIKELIIGKEFTIQASKVVWLNEQDMEAIYGHEAPSAYFDSCSYFMRTGMVEIGVISGDNAIKNFVELCGEDYKPLNCPKNSIRNIFGLADPVEFLGRKYYFNPIHRSRNREDAQRETTYFWENIYSRSPRNIVVDMVEYLYLSKGFNYVFDHHIKPAVELGRKLSEQCGANEVVVELSLWLHDIGRLLEGNDDNHHIVSARYAEAILPLLGIKNDVVGKIVHSIMAHRGIVAISTESIEDKVVASADGIINIRQLPLLCYFAYKQKGLSFEEGMQAIDRKVRKSFTKVGAMFKQEVEKEFSYWQKIFTRC